jgi:hypothetical protein
MTEVVGKIQQLTEHDIFNPKLMAPRCADLWEWYKTVAPRLKMALINRDGAAVEDIIDEIEAHAVEIEYQCRI